MNTGKRKILLFVMLLMIPVLALYGCGGNDVEDEENGEETAAEEDTSDQDPEDPEDADEDPEDTDEDPGDEEDEAADAEHDPAEDPDIEEIFSQMQFPENFSYEMVMDSEEMGTFTNHISQMGDYYRSEVEMEGEHFISIRDEEYSYMLDSEEMTALRMPVGEEEGDEVATADELTPEDDWDRLTYIGREEIDGINTYVIEERDNDVTLTMWHHPEYGIPIRVESDGPEVDDRYVMEVINFEVDHLTEEDFQVPEDYEIIDFQQ